MPANNENVLEPTLPNSVSVLTVISCALWWFNIALHTMQNAKQMPLPGLDHCFPLPAGILQMSRLLTFTEWKAYKESTSPPWLMVLWMRRTWGRSSPLTKGEPGNFSRPRPSQDMERKSIVRYSCFNLVWLFLDTKQRAVVWCSFFFYIQYLQEACRMIERDVNGARNKLPYAHWPFQVPGSTLRHGGGWDQLRGVPWIVNMYLSVIGDWTTYIQTLFVWLMSYTLSLISFIMRWTLVIDLLISWSRTDWLRICYVALVALKLSVFLHSPSKWSECQGYVLYCHTQLNLKVLKETPR